MFGSRARSCGILIEKPKYDVFVCKSFADFAEIPLAGPECPSHVIYLRSHAPLFVTRCFSEPLDFWEKEPHTHRSLFFQCKCFAAPVHNTIYWKACSRRFLFVDCSQSLSHEREVSNNFFFNGSQNLPCLFARNSQKNQELVIFVLLPCQQCCPGNWSQNWPDFVQVLCFIWQWGSAGREHLK